MIGTGIYMLIMQIDLTVMTEEILHRVHGTSCNLPSAYKLCILCAKINFTFQRLTRAGWRYMYRYTPRRLSQTFPAL